MKKVIIQNAIIFSEVAKLVSNGESVTIKTKGNSMLPLISGERDSVVLAKTDNIKLYDIVLAVVNENQYVLHRVIKIMGNKLILMGDGNLKGCEICTIENVIATAIEVIGDNRKYSCRDNKYIRKAKIWKALLPIRKYLLAIYKIIYKI
jgi:hypothetical protein